MDKSASELTSVNSETFKSIIFEMKNLATSELIGFTLNFNVFHDKKVIKN